MLQHFLSLDGTDSRRIFRKPTLLTPCKDQHKAIAPDELTLFIRAAKGHNPILTVQVD